ncbi:hypothetical protein Ais01nite_04890 [Asanoa ishikariensis]|uniref:Uncharacterized protein n=2 Tax=Asanoa ishikariensis TaxID=137265 RepID=A0A1H3TIA6_9ACTN|nr:hypothetical protein Ais01nite_04890 [Asanoa ishikariensis]SDZ49531.1 hypothetical protein SAMN05421684_5743 [Asanoa ishikariensis]
MMFRRAAPRVARRMHHVSMEDDERVVFNDEEAAFLRHARFGELPPRVLPDELVELQETEPRPIRPDVLPDEDVWRSS